MKVYVVYKMVNEEADIVRVCTSLEVGLSAAYDAAVRDLDEWKSKFREDEIDDGAFDNVGIVELLSDDSKHCGYEIISKQTRKYYDEEEEGFVTVCDYDEDDGYWTYGYYKVVEKEIES